MQFRAFGSLAPGVRVAHLVFAAVAVVWSCAAPSGSAQTWAPPYGIPAPPFGTTEVAGPITHYVNNTHPSATDTNNPNGSPTKPRRTPPISLPAGSVVEIRGGPYVCTWPDARCDFTAAGTAQQPVFIRGVGAPLFKSPTSGTSDSQFKVSGSYVVVEGLVIGDSDLSFVFDGHHVVLRGSEVRNVKPPGNSAAVYSIRDGAAGANNVVLRCHVHHNGNYLSTVEADVHGVKVSAGTTNFWVLDSELDHNGGQSMQVGDDYIPNQADWPHHIYYGRNLTHEDRESGFGMKQARDVILSQNEFWGYKVPPDGSNAGGGIALARSGSQWTWALFNRIHDSNSGIRFNGNDDAPSGPVYVIGNLIYNIRSTTSCGQDPPCYDEAAIVGFNNGQTDAFVVDNTVVNADMCIKHNNTIRRLELSGNVCQQIISTRAHLSPSSNGGTIVGDYLMLPPAARIDWETYTPITLAQLKAQGQCSHCKEGDAKLDTTYHPLAGSPVIDANTRHAAYNTFQSRYGLNIAVDLEGKLRPVAAAWDMGAFEGNPDASIADAAMVEGDAGQTGMFFTVTLAPAVNRSVTVNYTSANGSATAGSDYLAASGAVVFPPGSTSQRLPVTVLGDRILEPDEYFLVNLTGAVGVNIVRGQATGTISNDDSPGLSIDDVKVLEKRSGTGTATFTVTLSPIVGQAVTVDYATANGTATAGNDYVATSGTLTFPATVATQPINVTVNADALREPVETFTVKLSNPTGTTIAAGQGTGRIYDPGAFLSVNPCRVLDTRQSTGPLGGPALAANASRTFTIVGTCGIPANASAVAANLTVTQANGVGDLRVYPAGVTLPLASVINYRPGQTRANNVLATLNASGQLAVRCDQASGSVHLIVDVIGYFL